MDGGTGAYPMLMDTVMAFPGENQSMWCVHLLLTLNGDGWLFVILVEFSFPQFLSLFFFSMLKCLLIP